VGARMMPTRDIIFVLLLIVGFAVAISHGAIL
jgi:hypothetical protein